MKQNSLQAARRDRRPFLKWATGALLVLTLAVEVGPWLVRSVASAAHMWRYRSLRNAPLILAVTQNSLPAQRLQAVRALLDSGEKADSVYSDFPADPSALQFAAAASDLETVRLLLARGANPNRRDYNGEAALHWAIYAGASPEVVALLLSGGADPDLRARPVLSWRKKQTLTPRELAATRPALARLFE